MNNTCPIKDKLRRLLFEWAEFKLPSFTPRNLVRNPDKKKIIAISGVRGAGKTFACFEMINTLLTGGLPLENITYINFEDERLGPFGGDILSSLLEVQTELFVRDSSKPRFFFLDEVSRVPDWARWIESAIDQNPDLTIVVIGSISKMTNPALLEKIVHIPIYPYSFQEYLNARGFEMEFSWNLLFSEQRTIIKRHFNEYLEKGGFPEAANQSNYQAVLQQKFRTLFCRDMVAPNPLQNVRQFEDFIKIQINCFADFSSISTIEKKMKQLGYSLSKNTLMSYLRYALDAPLLFEVNKFNVSPISRLRSPRKLYAVDHGLVQAIRFSQPDDRERFLENIVFMELRRRSYEIDYCSGKRSCNFVIKKNGVASSCLQVCDRVGNSDQAEKKIRDLRAFLDEYSLESGMVLTSDEHANIDHNGKTIYIRPVWFFAIEHPGE